METKPKMETKQINELLFQDELPVYCVVDGAACPELLERLNTTSLKSSCLFSGELDADLQLTAPYLVELHPQADFTHWIFTYSAKVSCCIFIVSAMGFIGCRKNVRNLLKVYDENNQAMLFRFYDPRAFKAVLPTCDESQRLTIFAQKQSFSFFLYGAFQQVELREMDGVNQLVWVNS